jgi:hypothetical protein
MLLVPQLQQQHMRAYYSFTGARSTKPLNAAATNLSKVVYCSTPMLRKVCA